MAVVMVRKWMKYFCEGRKSVGDDETEERMISISTTADRHLIEMIVLKSRRRMARELATCVGMSNDSVCLILHKLGMWKMCSKFIPMVHTAEQKAAHVEVCQWFL